MNRWIRLSAAVTTMIMNGNIQYAWTPFVTSDDQGNRLESFRSPVGVHVVTALAAAKA